MRKPKNETTLEEQAALLKEAWAEFGRTLSEAVQRGLEQAAEALHDYNRTLQEKQAERKERRLAMSRETGRPQAPEPPELKTKTAHLAGKPKPTPTPKTKRTNEEETP